ALQRGVPAISAHVQADLRGFAQGQRVEVDVGGRSRAVADHRSNFRRAYRPQGQWDGLIERIVDGRLGRQERGSSEGDGGKIACLKFLQGGTPRWGRFREGAPTTWRVPTKAKEGRAVEHGLSESWWVRTLPAKLVPPRGAGGAGARVGDGILGHAAKASGGGEGRGRFAGHPLAGAYHGWGHAEGLL